MKKLLLSLSLLAGLVTTATAQERRMSLPGPTARPAVWASPPRSVGRAETRSRPMAQPVYRPGQYDRSVNLIDAAVSTIEIVNMVRFLKAHPEVLTAPRPAASAPDYYGHRRPVAAAGSAPLLGVKAGFNLSNITGGGEPGFTYRSGFSVGLMADFPLSDVLSFHPELLYSQKGAKYSGTDSLAGLPISLSGSLRLHYIDLPLLLRAKTNGFFFEAGPQLGYLIGLKEEATASLAGLGSGSVSSTDLDGYRRLDVGYVLGVGYQLPQGLEFGLRYNGGFSDL